MVSIPEKKLKQIRKRLRKLYGEDAIRLEERFLRMIGRYGVGLKGSLNGASRWNHSDVALITYGDMVQAEGENPLKSLKDFCCQHLKGAIKSVHILPFSPWTSDDGFSVVDYREVSKDLGNWSDVEALGQDFDLMFDLVLNHCSRKSPWFKDFVLGVAPGRHYFLPMDPESDLSQVVRPRTSPLLTKVSTRTGELSVWTTFSEDQVDLNWQNPDLLFEFLDILFLYISKGVRILRLDAVAFIWKNLGTDCLHQPETHEIVKLLRDICDIVAPELIILTETNVPHAENVSYFGQNDEAHMVYNFSLPPLLVHALLTGNCVYLREWASNLEYPGKKCTYLNFTASHDGIGVRPLQGLLPDNEFNKLIDAVEERGAKVSRKKNPDGSESPYELNITYASALSFEDDHALSLERLFCSQAVALAFKGVPAVYFHSLMATTNHYEGFEETGMPRTLNRRKWKREELDAMLQDGENLQAQFMERYLQLMRRRSGFPAFHPDGEQIVHSLNPSVFALERISIMGNQRILCLFNFTNRAQKTTLAGDLKPYGGQRDLFDVVTGLNVSTTGSKLMLKPYQVVWLVLR